MAELLTAESLVSLITLILLEVVLGIDNVIFISILSNKLPAEQRGKARNVGLLLAMGVRVLLLFGITWIIGLQANLFTVFGQGFSGRDLILLGGGIFLIAKSTTEIHGKLEGEEEGGSTSVATSFASVIVQIVLIDIVFSFDSILTAVGLVDEITIMVIAVIVAISVMMIFARPISEFVHENPTIKMLALSFLIMIGTLLVAEAFHFHFEKGYVYFAMAFSLAVELLNLRMRRKRQVALKNSSLPEAGTKTEAVDAE